MKLNKKKTEVMIFNYTSDKFSTRLYIEETLLEIVKETKLLGTIVTSDLKWKKNTQMLIKKAYQRMIILHKLYGFNVPDSDLVVIYTQYLRSILEQSCQVWHYSITEQESTDIERVQKVAMKVILKDRYIDYEEALERLCLDKLSERREMLCLRFAKKCTKHEHTKDMFPLNQPNTQNLRDTEKYEVTSTNTARLLKSAIPQLQRALNRDAK